MLKRLFESVFFLYMKIVDVIHPTFIAPSNFNSFDLFTFYRNGIKSGDREKKQLSILNESV